jgi:site-specific DNA-methyltransferase (adenine-specific)
VTPSLQNVVGGLDLRCCDCMDMMRECADKAFDLAIVDPPYGIGAAEMTMGKWTTSRMEKKPWDKSAPPIEFFQELKRVSRHQIIWGGNYFPLPPSRCWLIWDKGEGFEGRTYAEAELAWTSFDANVRKFKRDPLAMRDYCGKIHPTQKPVALYDWILRTFAEPGWSILDTHLGSGSIAIACHYAGHELTACEIDRDYYEAALQRIKRETAQMTLLDTPNRRE